MDQSDRQGQSASRLEAGRLEYKLAAAKLTRTEMRVGLLIRQGHQTRQIASVLSASPKTIHVHRRHIRQKLGLADRGASLFCHLVMMDIMPGMIPDHQTGQPTTLRG